MHNGYPPEALVQNPDGLWSLADGVDARALWRLDRLDGVAHLFDPRGRLIRQGGLTIGTPLLLRHGDGVLHLDRLFIDAELCLYLTPVALDPGRGYAEAAPKATGHADAPPQDIAGLACVGGGTMVATADGPMPVDWLRPGDRVLTRDNGYQPLLWLGQVRLSRRDPSEARALQLRAGALGPDLPTHSMVLGPGQPVLLAGPELELWFGEGEMLAAAQDLGARARPMHGRLTLFHLLFSTPQIILAEGLWIASVQASTDYIAHLPGQMRATMGDRILQAHATAARPVLRDWEAELVLRHRGEPGQLRAA